VQPLLLVLVSSSATIAARVGESSSAGVAANGVESSSAAVVSHDGISEVLVLNYAGFKHQYQHLGPGPATVSAQKIKNFSRYIPLWVYGTMGNRVYVHCSCSNSYIYTDALVLVLMCAWCLACDLRLATCDCDLHLHLQLQSPKWRLFK
jgi:hypothetical protein